MPELPLTYSTLPNPDDLILEAHIGSMEATKQWWIYRNYFCRNYNDTHPNEPQPCKHCHSVQQYAKRIETAAGHPLRKPSETPYKSWIVPRAIVAYNDDVGLAVLCLDCILEAYEQNKQILDSEAEECSPT